MKCKVIAPFKDRFNGRILYKVGDTVDWDDQERIADCTERGLIEPIPEKVTKPKTTRKPKTTTK